MCVILLQCLRRGAGNRHTFYQLFCGKGIGRDDYPGRDGLPVDRYYMDWRPLLRAGLFITVLFLIGAGWWFIRNAFLYHGDFLGNERPQSLRGFHLYAGFPPSLRQTYQNQGIGVFAISIRDGLFHPACQKLCGHVRSHEPAYTLLLYETYYRIFIIGLLVCMIPCRPRIVSVLAGSKTPFLFNGCMVSGLRDPHLPVRPLFLYLGFPAPGTISDAHASGLYVFRHFGTAQSLFPSSGTGR